MFELVADSSDFSEVITSDTLHRRRHLTEGMAIKERVSWRRHWIDRLVNLAGQETQQTAA